jgi:serine/threonine protein kinase/sugar lactone lactonase YvrE
MNAERWQQIDELFDQVLEIPEAERAAFLSEKCGADNELKREILTLLEAQEKSDKFMENSAMNIAAHHLANEETVAFESQFAGKTIGAYKIERMLGAGGMGEVYLAHDARLNRKVALKILPAEFVSEPERLKRFEIEARAVSALNHPNIVTIYDVGKVEGVNYIATEYVEGKTFRELIGGDLKVKEILALISQAAEALAAAHEARIIHRDIKPENIMVRPDGYVKVLDFGLAKLAEPEARFASLRTMKGAVMGTLAYMSPEQASGEPVNQCTDVWSLGVVLYEMLTGKAPFKAENQQATLNALLSGEPVSVTSLNQSLPTELNHILEKALEKDCEMRYQTASDFRADLKRVRREIDSSTSLRSTNSLAYKADLTKRKSYLPFLIGAAAIILFGLGFWFLHQKIIVKNTREDIVWIQGNHTPITDSPWLEGYPSLSPDGKNIVYASNINNDRNIYRQRVGGKNTENLTPNSKDSDTMPAYSFDGKFIAFRSERNQPGIYVMEETGENVRKVSDFGFHPGWSPDGTKIVVSDRAAAIHTVHTVPNSSLFVIDVKTGEKEKLETGGDAIMPNWSPNGSRIAFWFVADGKLGNIATIPAAGGEPVIVANDAASDWNPVWSPDGKYLYFASDRNGSMSFWRLPIDEKTGQPLGEAESVSTPTKYCRHLTFSRDGKILAYVRYESQSSLQSIAFDPQTLKASSDVSWITRGDKEMTNPDLSPNAEEYVVRQPTMTQEDLVVFDKSGGNWRNLTNDKFRERLPRWSPDGTKIAFNSDRSGKYQIWTINPDGTNLQQLTFSEKLGTNSAVFSPNGLRLAFTETDDQRLFSSILDLTKPWAQQTPSALSNPNNQSFSVRDWSNDGSKLLYIYFEPDGDEKGIGMYDLEKQTFEKITDIGNNPFWLNDNRHFIFTADNAIFLADAQTKNITELYKASAYELQHANISPDNKTIFFRYLQVDADVWMIESSSLNKFDTANKL